MSHGAKCRKVAAMTRTITVAAVLLSLTIAASPAIAQDDRIAVAAPTLMDTAPALMETAPAMVVPARISRALARPRLLPALYVSYAALQAFDVYSTREALALGGREANPLMQGVVGNTGSFVAVKAALTVGTIIAAERLWKTNKVGAIAVMVASNSVAALVAARNARTLGQLR